MISIAERVLLGLGRSNSWPLASRLALSAGLVGAATLIRLPFDADLGGRFIYMSYVPAVSIAAVVMGAAGAAFAAFLALLVIEFVFHGNSYSEAYVGLAEFAVSSAIIVIMAGLIGLGRTRSIMAEQTRRSAIELREFIRQAPVAIAMFDPQMRYIACSQKWLDDYGLGRRSIIGVPHYDVFPEIPDEWKEVHRRALMGDIVRSEEDRFLRADGSEQWLRWQVRPWRSDQHGNGIGGIIFFSEDITERKIALQKIEQNELLFRAMFENSAVGMAQVSSNLAFMHVNRRLCDMLGYSSEELQRLTPSALTFPDDRDEDFILFEKAARGEVNRFDREKRYIRKDGKTIWVLLSVSVVRDGKDKVAYAAAIYQDITERRRAEDALRKFSLVIDQAQSSVLITDENGVIEYVNPHFVQKTGYSIEEATGKRPSLVKSGLTSDAEYSNLWRTVGAGSVWRGELQNRRKDGSLFWEAVIISPIRNSGGRITHFASMQNDITEQKKLEKQFAEAQRMEAVGRLAGGIAHDFNNLLAVIAGNLELIRQRSEDPRLVALVQPALDAAHAGAAFNKRLLSLSRRRKIEPRSIVVNERIKQTELLLELAAGPEISIRLDLADGLWPSIADAGEIDSALLNLVTNSRDAMPLGGSIVIETRNVAIDVAKSIRQGEPVPGEYVRISVVDTGEGMRKEVMERAFEPFFTTKAEGRGTGLGLSSVLTFAKESGGFATIESRDRDGTTVNLFLPRSRAELRVATRSDDDVPYGDGELVLVVEDDEKVREVTLKRVEALGYAVEEARSGAAAIEMLKLHPDIRLVLSDIVMPGGMSGIELVRWIRRDAWNVKTILATGFSGDALKAEEGLQETPVLQKPFTREELAGALAQALRGDSG